MISNAIIYHNYEQPECFIKISVSCPDSNHVEIVISDNGQGIDPIYQSKIFDMFYRASTDSKGSGLGLYIVKNIIDKMNGTIELTSIPDIGTQFKMIFENGNINETLVNSQLEISSINYKTR